MADATLVSMKIDRKAREDAYATEPAKMDQPVYPYGLSITLDNDALDKLGLEDLPAVGGSLLLVAKVDVTATRESESTSGSKGTHTHRSVELQITDLQITDLCLEDSAGNAIDIAARLYNGDKAAT